MASKGPICKEENCVDGQDLLNQLNEAIDELHKRMKATIPIKRGPSLSGYGVNKTQRGIAADSVISIAKAIKGLKGW